MHAVLLHGLSTLRQADSLPTRQVCSKVASLLVLSEHAGFCNLMSALYVQGSKVNPHSVFRLFRMVFHIFVNCRCSYRSKTLLLNVWPGALIEDIKGEVGDTIGMDPSDVRLMFNDNALEDDNLRLLDIGINENSVLNLLGESSSWQYVSPSIIAYGNIDHIPSSGTLQSTLGPIDVSTIETDQNEIYVVSDSLSMDSSSVPVIRFDSLFILGLLVDIDIVFARCPWKGQVIPSVRDCMENPQCWFFQPAASLTRLVMTCKQMVMLCDIHHGSLVQHITATRLVVNMYNEYIWNKAVRKSRGLPRLPADDVALDRAARSWDGSRPLFSLLIDTDNLFMSDDEGDEVHAASG